MKPIMYKHRKGGLYELKEVAIAEWDRGLDLAIYECSDGLVYARPLEEFEERFEIVYHVGDGEYRKSKKEKAT